MPAKAGTDSDRTMGPGPGSGPGQALRRGDRCYLNLVKAPLEARQVRHLEPHRAVVVVLGHARLRVVGLGLAGDLGDEERGLQGGVGLSLCLLVLLLLLGALVVDDGGDAPSSGSGVDTAAFDVA